jgi:uncharacterized protein with von Willebrand factor type A (vWA) domain
LLDASGVQSSIRAGGDPSAALNMCDMRTGVHEAYDAGLVRTTVLPVLALVRRLRAGGVPVSTGETIDAARALAAVDLAARRQVHAALRATLLKDANHDDVFDRAFEALFPRPSAHRPAPPDPADRPPTGPGGGDGDGDPGQLLANALLAGTDAAVAQLLEDAVERWAGSADDRSVEHHTQRVLRRLDLARLYRQVLRPELDADPLQRAIDATEADQRVEEVMRRIRELVAAHLGQPGAGEPAERRDPLDETPLLRAGPDELAALRSAVRPLARRLATRLHRQSRRRGRGSLDMRRTLRRSLSAGGVPAEIVLRRRRPTKPELVVLCDVSGSTAQFAPFTLALLHAVHQEFRRVRSFVFVDGIVEITELLESAPGVLDPRHLLDRRGLLARDGRSDYTLAFGRFLAAWPDVVGPQTTVIVAGDARSHDRPAALPQLAELARLSRRLYWLDPEPRTDWHTADSAMPLYAAHCTGVFEVSTLRQLADCVAAIA